MAILTDSGRSALAAAVKAQPIHLAWGTGSAAWDTVPVPPSIEATSLVAEVGRRRATSVQFAAADPDGSIVVPNGRFNPSATPTKFLYCQFDFDYLDSPGENIREVGVFTSTVVAAGLPAGQMFFLPNQVTNPGILLALERIPKLTRSANVQQAFKFVIAL